jgi:hypothetical protein
MWESADADRHHNCLNVVSVRRVKLACRSTDCRYTTAVRLCRPSEVVLEILPNPRIGTFWKEDSEVIKRDRGLWPDGSIRTTRAESTALVNGETLELSAVAFTGVIGIAHDGNS